MVNVLTSELNAPEVIAKMLVQRGVDSPEKVKKFFNPRIGDMHHPFLMKDMDKAIERIQKAQEQGEGVLIFGDYDVDGTTSVALAYSFFKDKSGMHLTRTFLAAPLIIIFNTSDAYACE